MPVSPAETHQFDNEPPDPLEEHTDESSLLDPQESTPHDATYPFSNHTLILAELEREDFHRSGHRNTVKRIAKAMIAAGIANRRLWRFALCGKEAIVLQDKTDPAKITIHRRYCRDRFCPRCQAARAATIRDNVAAAMEGKDCRLITLTLQSTDQPLAEQTAALWAAFARLRRSRTWKTTQTGGVANLEITLNPDTLRWHPHLHVISEGTFIAFQDLKQAWRAASRGSYIVHVTRIQTPKEVANYVAHYATKLYDANTVRSRPHLAQAIVALQQRKSVAAFGTWTKLRFLARHTDDTLRCLGTLDFLQINGSPSLSLMAIELLGTAWHAAAPTESKITVVLPNHVLSPHTEQFPP